MISQPWKQIILILGLVWAACAVCEAAGPATANEAAEVLDLRTFPRMEKADPPTQKSLGMLYYNAPGDAKTAFNFQKKQLSQLGWKEQPGTILDASACSGQFSKEGYSLSVSTYPLMGDPQKNGWTSITLTNHGNVDLGKLAAPPKSKPFFAGAGEASYLSEQPVADVAKACAGLFTSAGWEPYGTASSDANSPMNYYKKNAVRVMCWVSSAPAQGNKTMVRYSAELLSADLPFPPDAPDPRYSDLDKSMRYDYPGEQIEPVVKYYEQKLTALGWKATTERPVVDDRKKTAFLIFRNAQKELLSLDMEHYTGIVRVKLVHQTAEEVAQEEERMHAEQAKRAATVVRETEAKAPKPPQSTVAKDAAKGKNVNLRDLPGMENLPPDVQLPDMPELGAALEAMKQAEKLSQANPPVTGPQTPLPRGGLEAIANLITDEDVEATPAWEYQVPKLIAKDMKQNGVKLTIGGKVYALDYGIAYQVPYINDLATEIALTIQPVPLDKLVSELNAGKDGSAATEFETRLVLRYDPSGQICGMNLYADGTSVSVAGTVDGVTTGPLKIENGRVKHTATLSKTKSLSDTEYEFTAPFDVPVVLAKKKQAK